MLREAQRNIYFNLALVWEEGMEWKEMKRIILKYSSLLLFGSFIGGLSIPLFETLSRRE